LSNVYGWVKVGNDSNQVFFHEISDEEQETRLDIFLSSRLVTLSRSRIQALIRSGNAKVNSCRSKPSHKLRLGDKISLLIPPPSNPPLEPEALELNIIHEDNSLIVLNKQAGLVVHPAPGHARGTLVHALLHHCQDLSGIGGVLRPGIVHRLDKDTSGLMVVAKSDLAHALLSKQFKSGMVKKQYVALVHGRVEGYEGEIELPVGRHPKKRKEMAVTSTGGRSALTLWQKIEEFQSGFSLLSLSLKTGRTHQIRVHLSHLGHPVAGDQVYGYGRNWWKRHPLYKKGLLPSIHRHMLHARSLGFIHPTQRRYMEFEVPLPDDMQYAVKVLKRLDLKPHANKELDIHKKEAILT
jgi:23S rRNA pseudouridine1911/1915/1917 synthase